MGDSDTLNSEGGEKTHTLTTDEMPSHNHIFRGNKGTVNVSGGNHTHIMYHDGTQGSAQSIRAYNGYSRYYAQEIGYSGNLSMSGEFTPSGNIDNAGGLNGATQPHNNMPPYIVKYCWERIA